MTCGGLCPGLNDVVQNLVYTLADYGVPEDQILGIRYGLRGFYERDDKPITLTRHIVDGIHLKGGTMLVRGRGGGQVQKMEVLGGQQGEVGGEVVGGGWWLGAMLCVGFSGVGGGGGGSSR